MLGNRAIVLLNFASALSSVGARHVEDPALIRGAVRAPATSTPRTIDLARCALPPLPLHIRDPNHHPLPQRSRCPRNRIQRHRHIPRIKQTIQLRPARPPLLCPRPASSFFELS